MFLTTLILSVFLPDAYIPKLVRYYKNKCDVNDENQNWYFLPKHLGWVERALYVVVLVNFRSEFITFIGIWLALKTFGEYKGWGNLEGQDGIHKGRAKFLIYIMGTALSILSVLTIEFIVSNW